MGREEVVEQEDDGFENGRDLVTIYFSEIKEGKLLSAREEVYLARRIERGNKKARQMMIEANLRLTVFVAKRYIKRINSLQFEDIIQEGNLGLFEATDKFNWRKRCRFSTYATYRIYQKIQRAIISQNESICVPVHIHAKISFYSKTVRDLIQQLCREPSLEEIAVSMKMTVKKVLAIRTASMRVRSLDAPISEEESESNLLDIIRGQENCHEDEIDLYRLRDCLHDNIEDLSELERIVVRKRYGVGGEDPHTLEMLGAELGLTKQRISQIEKKALKKLAAEQSLKVFKKDLCLNWGRRKQQTVSP